MSRRIIDLSVTLTDRFESDPPGLGPKITYHDHDAGALEYQQMFGVPVAQQLDGKGPAIERLSLSTHNGTHLDAPYHYHPTMQNGKPALTIDEIPLEWCMGPGVKLDFRHLPDGHVISAGEIEAAFQTIGHVLMPGEIVLINTRAGALYGTPGYVAAGIGIGREATLWLTERGMRVCGTDAWSWDAPLMGVARNLQQTKQWHLFWEGHKAGAETLYCHMEKLANLDQLPASGFEVICFPVKVERGSAGWCRPVAILNE